MNDYIELQNVTKIYETDSKSYTALKDVSIQINKGEFIIVKGKSGSGKSTILNLILGIDKPTSGNINIQAIPVDKLSNNKLASFRGKHIGIVFQFFQLMPTLTVLENVLLPMELNNVINKLEQRDRGIKLIKKLGIISLKDKFPNTLSGGEKQRVAVARALANNPDIIVADEPTGNLDSQNTKVIHDLFTELNKAGKTIIYVTHEKDFNIDTARTIYIKDGKVGDFHE